MPSGPEGNQEISEQTLTLPEYNKLDFICFLSFSIFTTNVGFLVVFFLLSQVTAGTYSGVLFLASFCIIVIYCTCNELVSI